GGRRLSLEIVDRSGRSRIRDVIALRVHAAVPRTLPEVSAGQRDARLTRPHRTGPRQRKLVRDGGLAQADEIRLLHEAELGGGPRLAQRDNAGLLPQRRRRIHEAATVVARLTADAIRTGEEVVASLQVD